MVIKTLSLGFVFITALQIQSAWAGSKTAEETAKKIAQDYSGDICGYLGGAGSRNDCYSTRNKYLETHQAPTELNGMAAYQLALTQAVCNGNQSYSSECWGRAASVLNGRKSNAPDGTRQAFAQAIKDCSTGSGGFFGNTTIGNACMSGRIGTISAGVPAAQTAQAEARIANEAADAAEVARRAADAQVKEQARIAAKAAKDVPKSIPPSLPVEVVAARNDFLGFASSVCGDFDTRKQDKEFCNARWSAFTQGSPIPTNPFDVPAYKLAFARSICSTARDGGEAYSGKCWQHVMKDISRSRTDSDAFKDGVVRAASAGNCIEQKGSKFLGIGTSTTYKGSCMDGAIAGFKNSTLPGRPDAPAAAVASAAAAALSAPEHEASEARSPVCSVASDGGTAIQVGGRNPLGGDNQLIVTTTGVMIKTPSTKEIRTFAYSATGGWGVVKADSTNPNDTTPEFEFTPKTLLKAKDKKDEAKKREEIHLDYKDSKLTIRSWDGQRQLETEINVSNPDGKAGTPAFRTTVDVRTGLSNLGHFESAISKAKHEAEGKAEETRIAGLRETEQKSQRKAWDNRFLSRMHSQPAAHADLAAGVHKERLECGEVQNVVAHASSAEAHGGPNNGGRTSAGAAGIAAGPAVADQAGP